MPRGNFQYKPWIRDFVLGQLQPNPAEPNLVGCSAQVLSYYDKTRQMEIFDGTYTMRTCMTNAAIHELNADPDGLEISASNIVGHFVAISGVNMVTDLERSPPGVVVIVKKVLPLIDKQQLPVQPRPVEGDEDVRKALSVHHGQALAMYATLPPLPSSRTDAGPASTPSVEPIPPRGQGAPPVGLKSRESSFKTSFKFGKGETGNPHVAGGNFNNALCAPSGGGSQTELVNSSQVLSQVKSAEVTSRGLDGGSKGTVQSPEVRSSKTGRSEEKQVLSKAQSFSARRAFVVRKALPGVLEDARRFEGSDDDGSEVPELIMRDELEEDATPSENLSVSQTEGGELPNANIPVELQKNIGLAHSLDQRSSEDPKGAPDPSVSQAVSGKTHVEAVVGGVGTGQRYCMDPNRFPQTQNAKARADLLLGGGQGGLCRSEVPDLPPVDSAVVSGRSLSDAPGKASLIVHPGENRVLSSSYVNGKVTSPVFTGPTSGDALRPADPVMLSGELSNRAAADYGVEPGHASVGDDGESTVSLPEKVIEELEARGKSALDEKPLDNVEASGPFGVLSAANQDYNDQGESSDSEDEDPGLPLLPDTQRELPPDSCENPNYLLRIGGNRESFPDFSPTANVEGLQLELGVPPIRDSPPQKDLGAGPGSNGDLVNVVSGREVASQEKEGPECEVGSLSQRELPLGNDEVMLPHVEPETQDVVSTHGKEVVSFRGESETLKEHHTDDDMAMVSRNDPETDEKLRTGDNDGVVPRIDSISQQLSVGHCEDHFMETIAARGGKPELDRTGGTRMEMSETPEDITLKHVSPRGKKRALPASSTSADQGAPKRTRTEEALDHSQSTLTDTESRREEQQRRDAVAKEAKEAVWDRMFSRAEYFISRVNLLKNARERDPWKACLAPHSIRDVIVEDGQEGRRHSIHVERPKRSPSRRRRGTSMPSGFRSQRVMSDEGAAEVGMVEEEGTGMLGNFERGNPLQSDQAGKGSFRSMPWAFRSQRIVSDESATRVEAVEEDGNGKLGNSEHRNVTQSDRARKGALRSMPYAFRSQRFLSNESSTRVGKLGNSEHRNLPQSDLTRKAFRSQKVKRIDTSNAGQNEVIVIDLDADEEAMDESANHPGTISTFSTRQQPQLQKVDGPNRAQVEGRTLEGRPGYASSSLQPLSCSVAVEGSSAQEMAGREKSFVADVIPRASPDRNGVKAVDGQLELGRRLSVSHSKKSPIMTNRKNSGEAMKELMVTSNVLSNQLPPLEEKRREVGGNIELEPLEKVTTAEATSRRFSYATGVESGVCVSSGKKTRNKSRPRQAEDPANLTSIMAGNGVDVVTADTATGVDRRRVGVLAGERWVATSQLDDAQFIRAFLPEEEAVRTLPANQAKFIEDVASGVAAAFHRSLGLS